QTGQTVYVAPKKALELHNALVAARNEELEEIKKILKFYSDKIAENSYEITTIDRELTDFDILYSKTRYALDYKLNTPKITDKRIIKIVDGRHPLIGDDAVPLNLTMGEDFNILVITGPNTGGKTVVLKTVGLFALMTQCSIPIPAGLDSQFCIFDKIFVDIGDEQSIENSLSTFSGHIKKLIYILNRSTKNSLALIDELCSGTDPMEGAALAIGILKELKNVNLLSIVSTHYGELKNFASREDKIENGSMEFDNVTLAPTYKLQTGIPGSSKAFEISKRLGLRESVLNEARNNINPDFLNSEKLLAQLEQKNIELSEFQSKLIETEKKLKYREEELVSKKTILKEREKEVERLLKSKESEFLKESRKEFEALVKEIKTSNAQKDKIVEGRIFFEKIKNRLDFEEISETSDEDFKKGDNVRIISSGSEGYVIDKSNNQNEYIIQAGIIKMNVKSNDMTKIEPKKDDKNLEYYSKNAVFSPTNRGYSLDLRGLRYDDAERKLDEFISNCIAANNKTIRIIHGKGSGALRKCIQDYFTHSPFVTNFDFEKDEKSGVNYGITVAQLR
nr:Smr/MutS family protein [Spirochaetota bacterium]